MLIVLALTELRIMGLMVFVSQSSEARDTAVTEWRIREQKYSFTQIL
jgi:hypothetical protein